MSSYQYDGLEVRRAQSSTDYKSVVAEFPGRFSPVARLIPTAAGPHECGHDKLVVTRFIGLLFVCRLPKSECVFVAVAWTSMPVLYLLPQASSNC